MAKSLKCDGMLHGGDYNPEQWWHMPQIIENDLRLMKLAGCNAMSIGVFSWSAIEPQEGTFEFDWLDSIMDTFAGNNIYAILATPSAARPAWLSGTYPEVLRVNADRTRIRHGMRANHCYTSSVYREKVRVITTKIAERYKDHPALLLWHISNEYGGECHCDLCQKAFRQWLRKRFDNDLDKLNRAWFTSFWGHTYTDWSQIESPAPHGEQVVHGLTLDWKRFVSHQTIDFMTTEIETVRRITPDVPVTTNFMGTYPGLNYWRLAPELDIISWDSYPCWHGVGEYRKVGYFGGTHYNWDPQGKDWNLAADVAFVHNINRSLKGGKPFLLIESTPSTTNNMKVAKLKRPGMHLLSSLQAIAHGSDSVMYFQWRKSRGCAEQYHGAIVDHAGHENTRVFQDVAELGNILKQLDMVVGSTVPINVAIIYDWENRWAIDESKGPRNDEDKDYEQTCKLHYRPFWQMGIPVDVIDMESEFSQYALLIAPMLYMLRPGVAEKIQGFVESGGIFVSTYWSGIVDENNLCFLGGFPGPLRKVLGIWSEEIDALYPQESNAIVLRDENGLGLQGEYEARIFCDLIHAEHAQVLATYKRDFYAGRPAFTVNNLGQGRAYYITSQNEERFLCDFYRRLSLELNLKRSIDSDLPEGVTAHMRTDGDRNFIFIMNFKDSPQSMDIGNNGFIDLLTKDRVVGTISLPPYGVRILEEKRL